MELTEKQIDIITTTIELFVSEGFDKTSMDLIAQKSGCSKRTLYKYYSSKKVLLDEIIIYMINEKQKVIRFKTLPTDPLKEQIYEICSQKAEFLLRPNNIKLGKIILGEFLKDEGQLKMKIDAILKHESVYLQRLGELQKIDQLNNNMPTEKILETINEIVNGVIFFPVLFGRKEGCDEKDIHAVTKMLLTIL